MPCYDGRNSETIVYRNGVSPDEVTKARAESMREIKDLRNAISWLEAALCAVLNEVERRDDAMNFIAEASRNGLIGLVDFYQVHKKDDKSRLAAEIHKYSKDEQRVIRDILKELE
jgi:hypothetical protein